MTHEEDELRTLRLRQPYLSKARCYYKSLTGLIGACSFADFSYFVLIILFLSYCRERFSAQFNVIINRGMLVQWPATEKLCFFLFLVSFNVLSNFLTLVQINRWLQLPSALQAEFPPWSAKSIRATLLNAHGWERYPTEPNAVATATHLLAAKREPPKYVLRRALEKWPMFTVSI